LTAQGKATFRDERGIFRLICEVQGLFLSSSETSFLISSLSGQENLRLNVALAGFSGGLNRGFSQFLSKCDAGT
jgi:hypothetical protein